jgi:hypothetical protein
VARTRRATEVHTITGARRGVTDDVSSRTRRYLISMGIRTLCFVLAVVFHGWARWVFLAGALFLPYFSVVFANSGRERIETMPTVDGYETRLALERPPGSLADPPPGPVSDTPGTGQDGTESRHGFVQ